MDPRQTSALVAAGETADSLDLGKFPLLVAQRAYVPRLQPALDAVQMEYMSTAPCAAEARQRKSWAYRRKRGREGGRPQAARTPCDAKPGVVRVVDDALRCLVLDRRLVQVVAADGTGICDEIPRPDCNDVPLLHPVCSVQARNSERGVSAGVVRGGGVRGATIRS
jgi:hypothetical protein